MSETEITSDDIEAAYKVIEYLRDEWAVGTYESRVANDAHYLIQQYDDREL